ncbi:MAG: hypothetical protein H7Z37_06550 [Pyrinomonadaceae bacterium]|nr:hypothetical protein [Pyrinomonadaceae bacterium]
MATKITVICFISLCFVTGIVLTVLPWLWFNRFGVDSWSDNYLLVYASQKAGLPMLQQTVASGWIRGAVSALGVFNLFLAFWEIANFNKVVRQLENGK